MPCDAELQAVLTGIDEEFSLFNPASHLRAVNDGLTDSVGPRFAEVLDIAQRVSSLSGGVYDPTVAPLTELWGFGASTPEAVPDSAAIDSVLLSVGIAACRVDSAGHLVRKSPATRFDFGSIAKGYGIDEIGRLFARKGIDNYMIEIGGEVLASGVNPRGVPWRIQVDSPSGGLAHERLVVVELGPEPGAIASSGNYRNYRSDGSGHVYGHTLSPLTGRPVESSVVAATVIADDCATADALATACMASAHPDSAAALVDRAEVEAIIVVCQGDSLTVLEAGKKKKRLSSRQS